MGKVVLVDEFDDGLVLVSDLRKSHFHTFLCNFQDKVSDKV